jgi:DNA-binding winged helix-turn-helix (wHTH) protein/tetratricopeptide (TPR) repeat protein
MPAGSSKSCQYEFDAFRLDPVKRVLLKNGERVALTGKSIDTLVALVERPAQTIAKSELMQAVWGCSAVEENNLNQCISAIRRALGEQRAQYNFILTVSGVGYRFVADVHNVEAETPAPEPVSSGEIREPQRRTALRAGAALAVLLAIAAGIYAVRPGARLSAAPHTAVIVNLKVLPATPENNWLSTALGEMLYHELADPGSLRVISPDQAARMERELPQRSSAMESFRDIRGYTQADFAVAGAIVVLPGHASKPLRIDLHVQDLRSGEVIGSASAEGSTEELFALVRPLSDRMRQALGIAPHSSPAKPVIPSQKPAMQLYASGLDALRSSDFETAKDRFLQAVEADPSNALCYAALSSAWHGMGHDQKAADAARQAFELSSSLGQLDRLAIEGRYRLATHDWAGAAAIYEVILKLVPDSLEDASSLFEAYRWSGKQEPAQRLIATLRNLPAPTRDDPRIDLEEARMVGSTWSNYARVAELAGSAARKARQRQMLGLYARARALQGGALLSQGDGAGAAAARSDARMVCQEVKDSLCLAQIFRVEGNLALVSGKLRQAEDQFTQALKLARQMGNRSEQTHELNGLAVMHFWMRDFQAADHEFRESLADSDELQTSETETLIDYANLMLAAGRLPEAIQAVDRALMDARRRHEVASEVNSLSLRAEAEMLTGRPRNAIVSATEALGVAGRSASPANEFTAEIELAMARTLVGDAAGAHDSIRKAAGYRDPDIFSKLELALLQTQVAFNEGDYRQAERFARDELEQARIGENSEFELRGENLLVAALLAQDRAAEAQEMIARQNLPSGLGAHSAGPGLATLESRVAGLEVKASLQPSLAWASKLNDLAQEAQKIGYVQSALEIRLAAARWSVRAGDLGAVRQVESEAATLGYKSVAARAHRLYSGESGANGPARTVVPAVASHN